MAGKHRVFVALYAAHAALSLLRSSFSFVAPALLREGLLSKADVGWTLSAFALAYMISKPISAAASDHVAPRFMLAIGALAAASSAAAMTLNPSPGWMAAAWAANGLAQGLGWPAVAKLLTVWYAPAERGTYWALASTSQNVGAALAPLVVAAALPWGWAAGMLAPAGVGLAATAMPLLMIPHLGPSGAPAPPAGPLWPQLRDRVLPNAAFWCICCANMCGVFGRSGVRSWLGVYSTEAFALSDTAASALVTAFEIGGLLGCLAAGPASDYLAGGRRAPVLTVFMLLAAAAVSSLPSSLTHALPPTEAGAAPTTAPLCAALIGGGAYGALALIGLLAIEVSDPGSAGLATAVHGAVGQFGYVLSGYPLSRVVEASGWHVFPATCSAAFLAGAAALLASTEVRLRSRQRARDKVD